MLPLPSRRRSPGGSTGFVPKGDGHTPSPEEEPRVEMEIPPSPHAMPKSTAAPSGFFAKRDAHTARRAVSNVASRRGGVPQRLQAVDDQTVVPREVYMRMMHLGDEARGRLGYGQHRLVFAGPGG